MSRLRRLPRTGRLPLHELVADAPDRLNLGRRAAQLVAQPRDVDVYGARVAVEVGAPNELTQALARKHDARPPREHREQVELLGPQLDGPPRHRDLMSVRVHPYVTDFEGALAGAHALRAPQHGLHARG